ncbi:hypothetical protein PG996_004294 [Apiospora saccharicola]|uniref:Ubiquitin-like protease family profile domain-containing protein n=1 Tax=Apiospora saccharicola TaxID=335842 RepID=A0ABR1W7G1_9PEZI
MAPFNPKTARRRAPRTRAENKKDKKEGTIKDEVPTPFSDKMAPSNKFIKDSSDEKVSFKKVKDDQPAPTPAQNGRRAMLARWWDDQWRLPRPLENLLFPVLILRGPHTGWQADDLLFLAYRQELFFWAGYWIEWWTGLSRLATKHLRDQPVPRFQDPDCGLYLIEMVRILLTDE